MEMEQITRFLCFVLCAFVVACKSKNVDKTRQAVKDDNVVTITLSNRQNLQSYANVQRFQSGIYYNNNYIESQLHKFMENLFNNVQDDPFSRIFPQNFIPYYFIIPKFPNWTSVFQNIPKNPNLFHTPAVTTSTKTPNKVEPFTTSRPQANGNRRFPVENIPTLRPRTFFTQDTTTPRPVPGTKISSTTIVNTERPETTTAEIQEASTRTIQAKGDDKGPFFDDEDDTTRPIILLDTKSPKMNRRLDKKLRRMPEVEHGSMQAGI